MLWLEFLIAFSCTLISHTKINYFLYQISKPTTHIKMDKLASKLGGGHKHGGAGGAQNEDYVDKGKYTLFHHSQWRVQYIYWRETGLDSLETKYGHGKVDPHNSKVRQTNERITDSARNKFESATGYVLQFPMPL